MKRVVLLAVIVATSACGKKGPPLAPFVRVPAAVANVTSQRVGNDVYLSFPVPAANVDGEQPADIEALEVYAVTATRPPETAAQREVATLVATLPVRPVLPELPAPPDGSPPVEIPLPPGVDRGATAVVREAITPEARIAVELPVDKPIIEEEPEPVDEGLRPLVAPTPAELPRRHYFVVGVSPRGRKSDPSPPVSVPLESGSSAPGAPKVSYTETELTIAWPPSPDARSSTFLAPPVVPLNASAPPVPPPLPARSLGFTTEATTYNLYDVPATGAAEDPYALQVPAPLTPAPLAVTEHVIKGVNFGAERCFEVRPVDQLAGVTIVGPASPKACITPVDTFPPAAPRTLDIIAGPGVINLIWEANSEADLAGYLVLRGESPGDTLRAITPTPVAAATFRDSTVTPGTRYVYAVVAVDRANNMSPQSNRREELAR